MFIGNNAVCLERPLGADATISLTGGEWKDPCAFHKGNTFTHIINWRNEGDKLEDHDLRALAASLTSITLERHRLSLNLLRENVATQVFLGDERFQHVLPIRKRKAIELLRSWRSEQADANEQRETLEFLKKALDEDRSSSRKLFP